MCAQFIKAMDYTIEYFEPVKKFDIYTPEGYDTKNLPYGKLGFDLHKVNVDKIKSEIV